MKPTSTNPTTKPTDEEQATIDAFALATQIASDAKESRDRLLDQTMRIVAKFNSVEAYAPGPITAHAFLAQYFLSCAPDPTHLNQWHLHYFTPAGTQYVTAGSVADCIDLAIQKITPASAKTVLGNITLKKTAGETTTKTSADTLAAVEARYQHIFRAGPGDSTPEITAQFDAIQAAAKDLLQQGSNVPYSAETIQLRSHFWTTFCSCIYHIGNGTRWSAVSGLESLLNAMLDHLYTVHFEALQRNVKSWKEYLISRELITQEPGRTLQMRRTLTPLELTTPPATN